MLPHRRIAVDANGQPTVIGRDAHEGCRPIAGGVER
jgi:hypothetical protein